ncbi:conserved hypothetical protein [Ricinus communis]|uniref:Uncharacterized protein n=1 Tax=Ricinus communis TaxID=3988 RepID=B9TQF0_RICCO|nr:conserved hypothetical protein [Ricinus communis]
MARKATQSRLEWPHDVIWLFPDINTIKSPRKSTLVAAPKPEESRPGHENVKAERILPNASEWLCLVPPKAIKYTRTIDWRRATGKVAAERSREACCAWREVAPAPAFPERGHSDAGDVFWTMEVKEQFRNDDGEE